MTTADEFVSCGVECNILLEDYWNLIDFRVIRKESRKGIEL